MTGAREDDVRAKGLAESYFGKNALNPVREIVESPKIKQIIKSKVSSEKKLIPLSIGDPTVFRNLKTPNFFIESITKAAAKVENHGYLPSVGKLETRDAIAKQYSYPNQKLSSQDVILSSGCSGALEIVFKALLNPRSSGDCRKVLLPSPGFPLYSTLLNAYDIPFESYSLLEERNWECDLGDIENQLQADSSIVALLLTNPSNPTGSVYSKEHLTEILKLAKKYNTILIADEIYGDIVFAPNRFHPLASLKTNDLDVPVISVGGIAKEFLTPGFRVGWMIFYSNGKLNSIKEGAKRLSMLILGPNSLIQAAIPSLFDEENAKAVSQFKSSLVKTLADNAEYIYHRLNAIKVGGKPVFKVNKSQGSMYSFIKLLEQPNDSNKAQKRPKLSDLVFNDSVQFMETLLEEESVFVLPGTAFGECVTDMIRITLTPPSDVLKEACDRIENFINRTLLPT